MINNIHLSVVIPAYNNCIRLQETLNSLLNQEITNNLNFEIIVIDNNSTDKTKEVVENFIPLFGGRLKYILEPNQGISYVRNRGIKETMGGIIAFTDDGCRPEKDWLENIYKVFKNHSDVDIVLGAVSWESGGELAKGEDFLRGNGMNLCFRKEVFNDTGYFDICLGAGSIGESGEDIELIYRAIKKNKKIIISDSIKVIHEERHSPIHFYKCVFRDSKSISILWLKHFLKKGDVFALKKIYWNILSLFWLVLNGIKNKNANKVKLKTVQLVGTLLGITKGIYIWIFFQPLNSRCQR